MKIFVCLNFYDSIRTGVRGLGDEAFVYWWLVGTDYRLKTHNKTARNTHDGLVWSSLSLLYAFTCFYTASFVNCDFKQV